jgi:hypothetical protein
MVKEPSDAVIAGMAKQTEGRRLEFRASLRPQNFGLAWLGLASLGLIGCSQQRRRFLGRLSLRRV